MPDRRAQGKCNEKASAVQHDAIEHLVHGARRLWAARLPDDLGRYAGNCDIVRYRLDDNRSRGNARAVANLDVAQDFRACADHYAAADFRMTVFVLLAGTAERHVMQNRNIIFDDSGFADNQSGRMIEENAAPDFRRRIDIALEDGRRPALKVEREVFPALSVKPMREAMRLDGVEALVVEHRFNKTAGRRIPIDGRDNVGAEGFAKRRLILERVIIGLADHVGRDVGVIQTLAHSMRNRGLKRVVMEDVFIDEGGELRLAVRDILRFIADSHPDRIDLVEAPCGPRLKLSHEPVLPTPLDPLLRYFITNSKTQGGRGNAARAWLMRVG